MTDKLEKLWTVDDVAEFCRVKPSVVKYWVRNTDLPFLRLGRQVRFEPGKVKEWITGKSRAKLNLYNFEFRHN